MLVYQVNSPGLGFIAVAPIAMKTAAIPGIGPVIAAGILAGASIFQVLFGRRGKDKLHDTAVVEAAQEAFNVIWYEVSGEAIDGVRELTQPGQYGRAGIGLFRASQYPNVPDGPAGNPAVDLDRAMESARATYDEAARAMKRRQSVDNLRGNFDRVMDLLGRVKQARQTQLPEPGSLTVNAAPTSSGRAPSPPASSNPLIPMGLAALALILLLR